MEQTSYPASELRSVDPGHEVLQIFADPFETTTQRDGGRVRAGGGGHRFPRFRPVRATSRGFESNDETFEPGQHGQAS